MANQEPAGMVSASLCVGDVVAINGPRLCSKTDVWKASGSYGRKHSGTLKMLLW